MENPNVMMIHFIQFIPYHSSFTFVLPHAIGNRKECEEQKIAGWVASSILYHALKNLNQYVGLLMGTKRFVSRYLTLLT